MPKYHSPHGQLRQSLGNGKACGRAGSGWLAEDLPYRTYQHYVPSDAGAPVKVWAIASTSTSAMAPWGTGGNGALLTAMLRGVFQPGAVPACCVVL